MDKNLRLLLVTLAVVLPFSLIKAGIGSRDTRLRQAALNTTVIPSNTPLWTSKRGNARNMAQSRATQTKLKSGAEVWKYAPALGIGRDSVAVTGPDDTLYISSGYDDDDFFGGTDSGFFRCLDAKTGKARWQIHLIHDAVFSSACVGSNGLVYVASVQGKVYAVGASDGTVVWTHKTGKTIFDAPLLSDHGNLYVMSHEGCLCAIDAKTGAALWEYKAGKHMGNSVAAKATTVYVGGDGAVAALRESDGGVIWKFQSTETISGGLAVGDATVYAAINGAGLLALDEATGTKKWVTKFYFATNPAVSSDGMILVGGNLEGGSYLFRINPLDGATIWKRKTNTMWNVLSDPVISSASDIYVGSYNDLLTFDRNGLLKQHLTFKGRVESPSIGAEGTLFVSAIEGKTQGSLTAINP